MKDYPGHADLSCEPSFGHMRDEWRRRSAENRRYKTSTFRRGQFWVWVRDGESNAGRVGLRYPHLDGRLLEKPEVDGANSELRLSCNL